MMKPHIAYILITKDKEKDNFYDYAEGDTIVLAPIEKINRPADNVNYWRRGVSMTLNTLTPGWERTELIVRAQEDDDLSDLDVVYRLIQEQV